MAKQWSIEWAPIESLFPNPSNPRHNDEAVPHVVASIRRFGWQQPLVAKASGELIAGHTRYKAALELGDKLVPVVRFEGTDLDAVAFGIADNKSHEFSTWDDGALAKLLQELRDEDALEGVGFSTADIDELIAKIDAELGTQNEVDDQGPEEPPVVPVSRLGDLWCLGDHRLLVGDSTSAADITRLMAGDKAALLATDSPYAVEYDGMNRPCHDGKPSGKDWSALYHETDIKDHHAISSASMSRSARSSDARATMTRRQRRAAQRTRPSSSERVVASRSRVVATRGCGPVASPGRGTEQRATRFEPTTSTFGAGVAGRRSPLDRIESAFAAVRASQPHRSIRDTSGPEQTT